MAPDSPPPDQKESRLKLFSLGVLLLSIGYGLFAAMIYLRQDKLIFYPDIPDRDLKETPERIGLDYQNVSITTADNVALHAWFIPHPHEQAVVLFCHGNAGNISHRLSTIETLHDLKLSVFLFDYRGYGKSEGKITETGSYLDAQAAWQYLTKTRHYHPDQIIIWGRSLGAAIAANLAAQYKTKGVILESTFTSIPNLAADLYPLLPVRWMSRYKYNVLKSVKAINSPLLIVHSRDDEIIPYKHGQQLFGAANAPKDFLEVHGSHDAGLYESYELYTTKLTQFLQSLK